MPQQSGDTLQRAIQQLDPAQSDYALRCVEEILSAARRCGATDVHLQPTAASLEAKFRIDGVLLPVADLPAPAAANVVARLKVLAGLLTYHTDRPQEGRVRLPQDEIEMRVCTYPTLHGERVVVRLFAGAGRYKYFDDLGLPADAFGPLKRLLGETSGAILVSGPAGSGKTTTVYACLREIARASGGSRSIISIEDPVEAAVEGAAQSQVRPTAGLDLAAGLRFLMRQDPEVIMVGEIRDRATAEEALRASLTGHLVLSTFHAGSAAETVGRLSDMGIEPYVLRSGVLAIMNQRLLRRLCTCAEPSERPEDLLGLDVARARVPRGCEKCGGTGYRGRLLLAEMLPLTDGDLARAVLDRRDTKIIERMANDSGMIDRWGRARRAVEEGLTSPAEVRRVLGFSEKH
ncbi:MAG: type II/IV secretion system protein [Pirellulales bacterium]|nr:type II/IV secretion system protein [Pirellulales bacterium]